ncbi:MAG: dockerin type I repeat-containing protein [Ruminococcus sp.]|nr:dockerin type I repeat-containing protein [Ruminococcus sp.]
MGFISKIISLAAATAVMSAAATPAMNVSAVQSEKIHTESIVSEEEAPAGTVSETAVLPSWVPSDFVEAMEFDSVYGRTHIEDGFICLVRKMQGDEAEYSSACAGNCSLSADSLTKHEPVSSSIYHFTMPEKPDRSDEEAYSEYLRQMDILGLNSSVDYDLKPDIFYGVEVYQIPDNYYIGVNWIRTPENGPEELTGDFLFTSDENGVITEEDIYGWLPDSVPEFRAYTEKYGDVSVQGKYIVFCKDIAYSAGYDLSVNCLGAADISRYLKNTITQPSLIENDGGSIPTVILYTMATPGLAKVEFCCTRFFDNNLKESTVKRFRTDSSGKNLTMLADDESTKVKGDCNGDGVFCLSDVITLQKWLIGKVADVDILNADVNEDGAVNSFDLVRIRKMMLDNTDPLTQFIGEPKPIMALISNNNAWGRTQDITVFDENGNSYNMIYAGLRAGDAPNTYSELFNFTDSWYEDIVKLMNDRNAVKDSMTDVNTIRARVLSENITKYMDLEFSKRMGGMHDAPIISLYIFGKDKDGSNTYKKILSYCGEEAWLECDDTKAFIRCLAAEGKFIYPEEIIALLNDDDRK